MSRNQQPIRISPRDLSLRSAMLGIAVLALAVGACGGDASDDDPAMTDMPSVEPESQTDAGDKRDAGAIADAARVDAASMGRPKVSADTPIQQAVVGFWNAGPLSCAGQFEIAYGISMCTNMNVSGIDQVATAKDGALKWLDQGTYTVSSNRVTLTLRRTVVEPALIRGDMNQATLVLERRPADDTLVVVDANGMPECTGLILKRADTVTKADCEPSGSGAASGGCTADVDCGECKRCEQSTGRCLTKLTCGV